MRNLKKVLALVLAMAMSLSLAVTAGAAFNDQDKIVNTEAVDMCVALNIINGRTDGSFDPAGNVTRAEMAKMICIVLNGGKEPTTATKAVPTFADIDGHWAEGYVEYCYAKGVVAGKSATEFAPNAGVTGTEAAKMLLVALGYNATVEKMVGENWALYTNVLANQDGLYDELASMDPSAALSRDNAAQMIWNTLNAYIITATPSIDSDGSIAYTYHKDNYTDLLKAKYGAEEWVGTITGYNDEKAVFAAITGGKPVPSFEDYTADDSDLIGKTIKVIYKEKTSGKQPIYGLFLDDDNTYIETIVGNIEKVDNDTIKVDGTKYDYATTYTTVWTDTRSAQPVTVILNKDGDVADIKADADFDFGQVAFVGTKSVQVTNVGSYTELDKNVEMYDGMAKDDYVVADKNDYTNKTVFSKVEKVTGKVEVVNGNDVTIDGTVYTKAFDGFEMSISGLDLGNTVEFVAVDGYIYFAAKVAGIASLDEVVYISAAKVDNDYGTEDVIAKATFADGTAAEINVVKTDAYTTEAAVIAAVKGNNDILDGLYAFDLDDDEYTLTAITSGSTTADFEVPEGTTNVVGKDKVSGMRVNGDAVIFVVDKDGKVAVKSGADVAAWGETTVAAVNAFANKTNGVAYVELAAVVMGATQDTPDADADAIYGYVTKVLGQTKEDTTYYDSFVIWTANGEQTIKVKTANITGTIAKGDFVKFENSKLNLATGADAAISGMVEKSVYFGVDTKEYVITDDTQIIYINVEDVVGAEGALQLASDLDGVTGDENNVNYLAKTTANSDGAYELVFVFVDVNNDMNDVI